MIEDTLERIAVALERIASGQGNLPLVTSGFAQVSPVADAPASVTTTSAPIETTSEPPKRRGRPPKVETPAAVQPVVETREEEPATDSFLDEPVAAIEPKTATVEDVRIALTEVVKAKGGTQEAKNFAYKILFENGDKAQRLPGSPQDAGNPSAPGALKPEKFQAVIDAARKALNAGGK